MCLVPDNVQVSLTYLVIATSSNIMFCFFRALKVASPPLPPKRSVFTSVLDSVEVSLPIQVCLQRSLRWWWHSFAPIAPHPAPLESVASASRPQLLPLPAVALLQ